MPHRHAERKTLPYTPEQLFELVADINSYEAFLPWCRHAKIRKIEDDVITADLVVGYKLMQEKFTSRVRLETPDTIHVEYLDGPMRYLHNKWLFIPAKEGQHCTIDFYVEFEFRSLLLQKVMGVFFHEVVRRMVSSFEMRAKQLYGEGSSKVSSSSE